MQWQLFDNDLDADNADDLTQDWCNEVSIEIGICYVMIEIPELYLQKIEISLIKHPRALNKNRRKKNPSSSFYLNLHFTFFITIPFFSYPT